MTEYVINVISFSKTLSFFTSGRDRIKFHQEVGGECHTGSFTDIDAAKVKARILWSKFPSSFRTLTIWCGRSIVFQSDNFPGHEKRK